MKKLIRRTNTRTVRFGRLAASAVAVAVAVAVAGAVAIAAGQGHAAPALDAVKASPADKAAKFKHPKLRHGVLTVDGTEAVYRAVRATRATTVVLRDTNFADRIGWKEIVVRADHGASIQSSTAPAESASDELRAYPKDLLRSPLDVTTARAEYEPG